MATFFALKDPQADLDYSIDWSLWLTGTDTLSTSTWIVPSDLTAHNQSYGTATTITWLSGGTNGEVYDVVNRVVTAGGRTEDRTIEFTMVQR